MRAHEETPYLKRAREYPWLPYVASCRHITGVSVLELTSTYLDSTGEATRDHFAARDREQQVTGVFMMKADLFGAEHAYDVLDYPYGKPFQFCPFCGVAIVIDWHPPKRGGS